jgi:hypothetical protein
MPQLDRLRQRQGPHKRVQTLHDSRLVSARGCDRRVLNASHEQGFLQSGGVETDGGGGVVLVVFR